MSRDFLSLTASLILTVLLVTVTVIFVNTASEDTQEGMSEISYVNTQLADNDLATLERGSVGGSRVIQYVQDYRHVYAIQIATALNRGGFYETDKILVDTSDQYVNPSGIFNGRTVTNENGVIVGLQFVQAGVPTPVFSEEEANARTEALKESTELVAAQYRVHTQLAAIYEQIDANAKIAYRKDLGGAESYTVDVLQTNVQNLKEAVQTELRRFCQYFEGGD